MGIELVTFKANTELSILKTSFNIIGYTEQYIGKGLAVPDLALQLLHFRPVGLKLLLDGLVLQGH